MLLEISIIVLGAAGIGVWLHRRDRSRAGEPKDKTNPSPAIQPSIDGLAPGDSVGGFVLEEFLGEGGMASVFKARKAQSTVALKVLKEAVSKDEQFRRRFDREVELCKDLSHVNIVCLQEWGEDNGRLFLALDYIEGQSLTQHLSPDGLALSDIRCYIDGLIQGLNYAHQRGIVHRDLKPDNVMVTLSGQIKIMDFGLARAEDGDKVTMTGHSMGTPAYLPPEQITGAKPTPAADQYSLGVILYEMLTGRRPFLEKNPLKMLTQHLVEDPPDPLELKPVLHPTCAAIVLRMLEKSPENRFAKLEIVSQGLSAVDNGIPWSLPEVDSPTVAGIPVTGTNLSMSRQQSDNDDTTEFQLSK